MSPAADSPSELAEERALLRRLRSGDREAFVQLYDRFSARLYRQVLMPVLGNPAAAEDALSETFRTAFQKVEEFQPGEVSVFFWLRRIARNKAIDMHRAAQVSGRALARFEQLLEPLAGSSPSPEALLSEKWDTPLLQRDVASVLAELNPRYRRAIELRFLEEQSREACAQALEVTVGTFDVLLLRSLRAFRKIWVVRHPGDEAPGFDTAASESAAHG